jgi:hypothetical protein
MDILWQCVLISIVIFVFAFVAALIVNKEEYDANKREKEQPDCKIIDLYCPCCCEKIAEKADTFKTRIGADFFCM